MLLLIYYYLILILNFVNKKIAFFMECEYGFEKSFSFPPPRGKESENVAEEWKNGRPRSKTSLECLTHLSTQSRLLFRILYENPPLFFPFPSTESPIGEEYISRVSVRKVARRILRERLSKPSKLTACHLSLAPSSQQRRSYAPGAENLPDSHFCQFLHSYLAHLAIRCVPSKHVPQSLNFKLKCRVIFQNSSVKLSKLWENRFSFICSVRFFRKWWQKNVFAIKTTGNFQKNKHFCSLKLLLLLFFFL